MKLLVAVAATLNLAAIGAVTVAGLIAEGWTGTAPAWAGPWAVITLILSLVGGFAWVGVWDQAKGSQS